ncbi:preprotein translocase subunit SecG [Candidatus Poribacteria bacterium]|nr:MAG: preprotein translocase subunit SecG [Candidatus Poribacteria bacterium]
MEIIVGFILVLFVPACILLPIIILLQDSKGEGLSSSAFGGAGGSMQSVLGGQGAATFLSKVTTWLAIGFMVMALFLMRFYGETGGELKPLQEGAAQSEVTITPSDETTETGVATDTAETDGTDSSSSTDDVEEGAGK